MNDPLAATDDGAPLIDLTEPGAVDHAGLEVARRDTDRLMTDPVRITCHQHGVCFYSGDVEPEGGAAAVAAEHGCPAWTALPERALEHDPADYDACPVPGRLAAAQAAAQQAAVDAVTERRRAAAVVAEQQRSVLDRVVAAAVDTVTRLLRPRSADDASSDTAGQPPAAL